MNKYLIVITFLFQTIGSFAIPYEIGNLPSSFHPWNLKFTNDSNNTVQFMVNDPITKTRILNQDVQPKQHLYAVVLENREYSFSVYDQSTDLSIASPYKNESGMVSENTMLNLLYDTDQTIQKTIQKKGFTKTNRTLLGKFEISDKATSGVPWNFEVYNKTNDSITVSVFNKNAGLRQFFGKPITIGSFEKLRGIVNRQTIDIVQIKKGNNDVVNYTIKPRIGTKTIFVTVDQNEMRPQTGILHGIPDIIGEGMTDSEMPFQKATNIKQNEIIVR